MRSRRRTGWVKFTTSHSRSLASRASTRSGFTATGWPTASIIGMSVALSLYAYDAARSMSSLLRERRHGDGLVGTCAVEVDKAGVLALLVDARPRAERAIGAEELAERRHDLFG